MTTEFFAGLFLGLLPVAWQLGQLRAASRLCEWFAAERDWFRTRDELRVRELRDADQAIWEAKERERRAKEQAAQSAKGEAA
jgi:hypothetical protein